MHAIKDVNNLTNYRDSQILKDFVNYDEHKKLTDDFIVPVNMHDNMRVNNIVISHSRAYKSDYLILWPLHHYHDPTTMNNIIKDSDTKWSCKKNKLIWRGASTGPIFYKPPYEKSNRLEIMRKWCDKMSDIDVGFNELAQINYNELSEETKQELLSYKKECISIKDQLKYKYVLNLEGNDYSSSFMWALGSNSCPLHTYPFSSENILFGDDLQPFIHFVPIKIDASDLQDVLEWCKQNDDLCKQIAENGKKYMELYKDEKLYTKIMKRMVELVQEIKYETNNKN